MLTRKVKARDILINQKRGFVIIQIVGSGSTEVIYNMIDSTAENKIKESLRMPTKDFHRAFNSFTSITIQELLLKIHEIRSATPDR